MTYKINTKILDYGVSSFNEWDSRDFILENTGKVTFEYRIDLSCVKRKGLIEVSPPGGIIRGSEKQKFHVRMCPGYPDIVDEFFFVEIAHFEPEKITIKGSAIYPALILDLPRAENPDFLRNLDVDNDEAHQSLNKSKSDDQRTNVSEPVVINKAEVEADRKTLVEYINKNLNEKRFLSSKTHDFGFQSPQGKLDASAKILKREPSSVSPGLKATKFMRSDTNLLSPTTKADDIIKNATLRDALSPGSRNQLGSRSMISMQDDKLPGGDDTKGMGLSKMTFKANNPLKFLDNKVYNKIVLASFICDLENIVRGGSKKKTFKITNVSTVPICFTFDARVYKLLNMTITPERVPKLDPGETTVITLSYQTKKNMELSTNKMLIPIEVKNGPKLNLEVIANITVPNIKCDNENVDFGKVFVGQKKTIFLRFENEGPVIVDWRLSTRADLASNEKDGSKFSMTPTSGLIKPKQKQIIEITFIPTVEKTYSHKFTINIQDNPTMAKIYLKGVGTSISLDFIPERLSVGPSLPYDTRSIVRLDVRNPTEYDTELYSLNFDQTYLQEEEMLRAYEGFNSQENVIVPVRAPNQPFWEKIKKFYEVKQRRSEFNRKMKELNAQPQVDQVAKDALQKEIDEYNLANQPVEEVIHPKQVKDELKHHLIVYGPPGCGRSQLVKFLSKTHHRGIININDLLEWNQKNKTKAAEDAAAYLEEREKAYEAVFAEYDKNKKKKKKGEEDIPPSHDEYTYLTEEIVVALLQERLKSPDCNAGVIFEGLSASFYPKEIEGLRAILSAIPDQHIQFVNLYYPTDSSGLEVNEIIDPLKDLTSYILPKDTVETSNSPKKNRKVRSPDTDRRQKDTSMSSARKNKSTKKTGDVSSDGGGVSELLEPPVLFEVNYPKELTPEELEQSKSKARDYMDIMLGQYKEPVIPVVEEVKKDDKKDDKKDSKKGAKKETKKEEEEKPVEVHEEPEEPKIPTPNKVLVIKDNRSVINLPIIFNHPHFNNSILEHVPEPKFPDPDLEPVPEPIVSQILKKPVARHRTEISKCFIILTPKENYINETDSDIIPMDQPLEEVTTAEQSRWVIPAKKKISVYVKFFTETPGNYESTFEFECLFATKGFKVPCNALCDFPSINSKAVNVFMQRKKFRPTNPPDCYISKHYVMTEKVFDFGPLLIGKDPSRKSESSYTHVNSSVFRITNNGKFTAEIDFTLASTVFEGPAYKKGLFLFEPEKLSLAVDQTEDLRVWAFPDSPQLYKDQVICMIKNNPIPVLFDVQCTGVKPNVEVDNNMIKFERLLLNQSATERLKIRNVCAVPVRWSLKGVDKLSEEFSIKQTSGLLRPVEEKIIEISFKAVKQEKFQYSLDLEVEDNEKIGIKQGPIEVKLHAEAFDINVVLDSNNPENMLQLW